jgi:NhaA family Na+:H+ antiporter
VRFVEAAQASAEEVRALHARGVSDIHEPLATMHRAVREAVSPVERFLHATHRWVAFGIMPLFAFANAGVPLGHADLDGDNGRVFAGIALGLVVGKTVGVVALSRIACALGIAALPRGIGWGDVSVVGIVAGIGFTMALFIAQLAFPPGPVLETAKLAVLVASAGAGVAGYLVGTRVLKRSPEAAPTEAAAEGSSEV